MSVRSSKNSSASKIGDSGLINFRNIAGVQPNGFLGKIERCDVFSSISVALRLADSDEYPAGITPPSVLGDGSNAPDCFADILFSPIDPTDSNTIPQSEFAALNIPANSPSQPGGGLQPNEAQLQRFFASTFGQNNLGDDSLSAKYESVQDRKKNMLATAVTDCLQTFFVVRANSMNVDIMGRLETYLFADSLDPTAGQSESYQEENIGPRHYAQTVFVRGQYNGFDRSYHIATTLHTTINDTTHTIVLADITGFPVVGTSYVQIGAEQIAYTGITPGSGLTGTLTGVSRGARSTTAASHNAGAVVKSTSYASPAPILKTDPEGRLCVAKLSSGIDVGTPLTIDATTRALKVINESHTFDSASNLNVAVKANTVALTTNSYTITAGSTASSPDYDVSSATTLGITGTSTNTSDAVELQVSRTGNTNFRTVQTATPDATSNTFAFHIDRVAFPFYRVIQGNAILGASGWTFAVDSAMR